MQRPPKLPSPSASATRGVTLSSLRAALFFLVALTLTEARAERPCGGCISPASLDDADRALLADLQRALQPDDRQLCLYDDADGPNAHIHMGSRPHAIHVGIRYWRSLTAIAQDDSLESRLDAFYNVAATVFHEYGHTLFDQLVPEDRLLASHRAAYGRLRRDTLITENYADCISGVVLGATLKQSQRSCEKDTSPEWCERTTRRSIDTLLRHAQDSGGSGRASHGTPESRMRLMSFGIATATPSEQKLPRTASDRCLIEAGHAAEAQLREQPGRCAAEPLVARLGVAINRATQLRASQGPLAAVRAYAAAIDDLRVELPECHNQIVQLESIQRQIHLDARTSDADFQTLDRAFRTARAAVR